MYTDTNLQTTKLNLSFQLLLSLSIDLLLQLTVRLALKLVGTTKSNVLRTEVTEEVLENILNQPAATVIEDHQHGQSHLELIGEGNKAQLLIQLRNELGGAGECNTRCGDKTPVHALVLADRLAEGTTLVVDREGGDLLDQLKEVDGTVQEGRLKLALQVNIGISPVGCVSHEVGQIKGSHHNVRLVLVDIVREVDQSRNVDSKLSKNRSNDVDVEDIRLGALLRQTLDRLHTKH